MSIIDMTLRDYFAGQALVGLTMRMNSQERRRYREDVNLKGLEARTAYAIADAMLRARDAQSVPVREEFLGEPV